MLSHSLCCAKIAGLISQEKEINNPDVIFTAGLLHDIGKVILDQYFFEKFNLIMDKSINEDMQFIDAENEILGYNHAQVGEIIARNWNLPVLILTAKDLTEDEKRGMSNNVKGVITKGQIDKTALLALTKELLYAKPPEAVEPIKPPAPQVKERAGKDIGSRRQS